MLAFTGLRELLEGKLFIVESDFEEDIFDTATLIIFKCNPTCAVLGEKFLNLSYVGT
jgi:hypothetical protein